MDSVKYELKLFLEDVSGLDPEVLIPIFTDGFKSNVLMVLIDGGLPPRPVGPGVVLIAHDAHYAIDMTGTLGLLYSRGAKRITAAVLFRRGTPPIRFHCA